MALDNCCYVSNDCEVNINDECVCLIKLGGILALCDGTIYRRVVYSDPCEIDDFVLETFGVETTAPFVISDEDDNIETIENNDTIEFIGQNGFMEAVGATNQVTLSKFFHTSNAAPSGTPSPSNVIHLHVNTTTAKLYVWNPVSLDWNIQDTIYTGNPAPKADFKLSFRAMTATLTSHSTSTQVSDTLTYAWSISPSSGVTIATPTASSTTVTFTTADIYTITLTVTDSISGATNTKSRKLMVDRIINLGGDNPDEEVFDTLQAVDTWTNPSFNTDMAANHTKYRLFINKVSVEALSGNDLRTVTFNETDIRQIFFDKNGQIYNAAIDFNITANNEKIYIAARDTNVSRFLINSSVTGTASGLTGFIQIRGSNSAVYTYFDNIWMQSYNPFPNSSAAIKSIQTDIDAIDEFYFNCKFTGTGRGLVSNSAGSRAPATPKNCRIMNCYIDARIQGINGEDEINLQVFNSYSKASQAIEISNVGCMIFNSVFISDFNDFPNQPQDNFYGGFLQNVTATLTVPIYITHNTMRAVYAGSTNNCCAAVFIGGTSQDKVNRFYCHNNIYSNLAGFVSNGSTTQSGGHWLYGDHYRFIHNYVRADLYLFGRVTLTVPTYPTPVLSGFPLIKAEQNTFEGTLNNSQGNSNDTSFYATGVSVLSNENVSRPFWADNA